MILTTEHIKQTVSDYFSDKPVKRVWLFGSYARGEAKEESDVDLLVEMDDAKQRLSLFGLLRMANQLSQRLQKKVEFIENGRLHKWVLGSVESDKTLVYEAA